MMGRPPNKLAAFGGAPLKGNKLVRITYMDEAGISANEPALVVASIIIDGDNHYKVLREELYAIVKKYIPEEDQDGFIFHATEIFSGGKYFNRTDWSRVKRWQMLSDILSLVPRHKIPVCLCFLARADFENTCREIGQTHDMGERAHATAFVFCALTIDAWMRANAKDEFTILVAEDANKIKSRLKHAHAYLSNPSKMAKIPLNMTPITRIVDTPHFVKKAESSILQIADAWAFIIRRKLLQKPDVEYFYPILNAADMYMIKFADVRSADVTSEAASAVRAR